MLGSRCYTIVHKKVKYAYCFRCKDEREIIDPVETVTRNNRNLCVGKCVECEGKVALMGGYARLPGLNYENANSP